MKTVSLLWLPLLLAGTVYGTGQIDIAYSPYTINNPGSYIVVKDLTTPQNLNGITISTSNITIDLNGHTLYGAGSTTGSSGNGIVDLINGANNVTIYNGTIRDFRNNGIELFGMNTRVEHVNVSGNNYYGIYLGSSALVADCNVSNNGYDGINLENSTGAGGIIRNNNVTYNGINGIYGQYGVVITGNHISHNQSDGILGLNATILNNDSFLNQVNGISGSYCLVENNNVDGNFSNGITGSYNRIVGNYCQSHSGGAGIYAHTQNTIENNTLYANSTGVFTNSVNNYIAGNSLTGNTVSIFTTAGNFLGDGTTGFFNAIH